MVPLGATASEVVWNVFAGAIILGLLALLIVDGLNGKSTWAGRLSALLFIPHDVRRQRHPLTTVRAYMVHVSSTTTVHAHFGPGGQ